MQNPNSLWSIEAVSACVIKNPHGWWSKEAVSTCVIKKNPQRFIY